MAQLLESSGWSVWWDRRIPAGENWRSVLEQALATMRCMVVLWSEHSVRSEWVCEEASEGRRLNKLIPVLIERVRPPAGFREIQAADLVDWDGSRDFPAVRELIRDLTERLGKPLAAAGAAVEPSEVGQKSQVEVATPTQSGEGVARDAPPARHLRPRRPVFLGGFAPWVVGAALALAAGAMFMSLDKQAHRESDAAPALFVPQSTADLRSPNNEQKVAQPLATTPSADAPTVSTIVPQRPIDSETVTTPSLGSAAVPKAIGSVPSESTNVKAADVKAARKPKMQVSAARDMEGKRCSDILQQLQLGGVLSDEKRAYLEKECQR